ncbi:MAG: MalY/PatB family protein [Bacillota bacterium]|nr:MalY/PatB family protein [Bacillota bacterium]
MKYDFDKVIPRKNTNSIKWDYSEKFFGVDDILPMWIADMDFETVPEIKDAIIERAQHNIYGYSNYSDEYYQTVIDWNKKRHDWTIDKDWICHSTGVVNAMFNSVRALTKKDDGIIIQTPVYQPFYRVISAYGCKAVFNPLKVVNNRYVPDIKDLENKLQNNNVKLLLLCNPHNPVGRVFTKEELLNIGELCLKYKVTVISDEIHSDIVFKEYKHIPFASLSKDFEQNSIICTSPSKTFNLAGIADSNIIIPNRELRNRYNRTCKSVALKSYNIFGAIAAQAAYAYGEEWLSELLDYIEENKNYVSNFLKNKLPMLKLTETEGTYFLWIDCREMGFNKEMLERFMIYTAKLWFNQGYVFGVEGEGFIRINIACSRTIVKEAMNRLEKAVNSMV